MSDSLAIAIAQLDPVVGDVEGNLERLRRARAEAAEAGADLVVATELVVSGYPPEDLVLKPMFLDWVARAVEALAGETGDGGPGVVLGAPWRVDPERREAGEAKEQVHNAALLLEAGEIVAVRPKWDLPNYGVFDEVRVFVAGSLPGPVNFRGARLGLMVCEDLWSEDVTECLEENGADILVVINGSPYETTKPDARLQVAVARVTESERPIIYANQVGGQDELVFDGASFVLDHRCRLACQLPSFEEATVVTRWARGADDAWTPEAGERSAPPEGEEAVYRALVLGLRDYVSKNGFPGVIVGLSGGIDSALTAAIAADALGPEAVHCVLMPSPYTSRASLEDAAAVAEALGCRLDTVGIEPAMRAFEEMLAPVFEGRPPGVAEENIQARARGLTLMAISNKLGAMVLSTGNKSEMSVGFATLYGDMCGGFNVLKDVYKTTVYALARWRNGAVPRGGHGPTGQVIPERILTKAPSAELRADQSDEDSLPPYAALDDMLYGLIEHDLGIDEIVARGHDRETVNAVWRMVETAEYKRRQAPPGVKITHRAFGRDRRYPITNAFKGPF